MPPDLDLPAHGGALSAAGLTIVVGGRDEFVSEEGVPVDSLG